MPAVGVGEGDGGGVPDRGGSVPGQGAADQERDAADVDGAVAGDGRLRARRWGRWACAGAAVGARRARRARVRSAGVMGSVSVARSGGAVTECRSGGSGRPSRVTALAPASQDVLAGVRARRRVLGGWGRGGANQCHAARGLLDGSAPPRPLPTGRAWPATLARAPQRATERNNLTQR